MECTLEEIPFASPHGLAWAARIHEDELLELARSRSVDLPREATVDALAAAVEGGYVPGADVRLPSGASMPVVAVDDLLPNVERYFQDVEAGTAPAPFVRPAPAPAAAPAPPTPALTRQVRRVKRRLARVPAVRQAAERLLVRSPEQLFAKASSGPFQPVQRPDEIVALLRLLAPRRPRTILEIGTANGGTTYLLSRVAAPGSLVVTFDIGLRQGTHALPQHARRRQRIVLLEGDSHTEAGDRLLRAAVPGGVDVLFIDGDHSYAGARQDLEMYADLVHPGGVIVFHDIVEDFRTRYGIATAAWVGGVPQLWREVEAAAPPGFETHRFIQDPDQDGFGIGALECDHRPQPGRRVLEALAPVWAGAARESAGA